MCAPFHSAGSSDYTMQPVLLQLIMCNLQNFLPSVHLLYSLMPNLITFPWFHRQINFLVCFLVLCRIQWPCDIPCCFHQSCSQQHLAAAYGSSLRMMFYISAFYNPFLSTHLNWTHWSCKNSSWWVWIIKQHWSKQLYLDQYYPYSIWLYHLLGRTVYAGSLSFLCFDKFLVNVINTSAWCLAFSPSSLIYPKSSYFLANIQKI